LFGCTSLEPDVFENLIRTIEQGRISPVVARTFDLVEIHDAQKDGLLDRYAMKTARVGGLTKARKIRDFCVELGVPIHFQCTWGAELSMAGMLHLSQSTPEHCRTEFWPLAHSSTPIATADGSAKPVDGLIEATHEPGLGVRPRLEILGSPVAIYQ